MTKFNHTDEEFIAAVEGSISYAQIKEKLGILSKGGSSYISIRNRIVKLEIPTPALRATPGVSHKKRKTRIDQIPLEDLKDNTCIKNRLLSTGILTYECARCTLITWLGEAITLELDHIDGNNVNNQISNLRLLCPNCHALTPTWRGRNQKVKVITQ